MEPYQDPAQFSATQLPRNASPRLEQFRAEPMVASKRGPRLSPWFRVWVPPGEGFQRSPASSPAQYRAGSGAGLSVVSRQAGGFESIVAVGEGLKAYDLAMVDMCDPGRLLGLQVDTTCASPGAPAPQRQYSVTEIAELLRARLEDLPVRIELFDPVPDTLVAPIDAALQHGHDR